MYDEDYEDNKPLRFGDVYDNGYFGRALVDAHQMEGELDNRNKLSEEDYECVRLQGWRQSYIDG